ncbi:MAG TPA: spore germination protein, partial [Pseudoneobacillus sp.]|nr:spore germination protein [Pseudoneobacillus sp.]
MNWFTKKKIQHNERETLENYLQRSNDYKKVHYINQATNCRFCFSFISTLIDESILQENVLPYLLEKPFEKIEEVKKLIPLADVQVSNDESLIEQKLFNGYVFLTLDSDPGHFAFLAAQKEIVRSITQPEVEFSVIGPKEAFVESLEQNVNLIRKRLPVKELISEELTLGTLSKTKISVMYLDGIADPDNIQEVMKRLKDVEFDAITDSSYIVQLISDNKNSPFPQLLDTERPDRVTAILAEGKIAIFVDGSPHVLITPTTLVEFFGSFEDYFLNWMISSFFR